MVGRPNKIMLLNLGDIVLDYRRAGLSYRQISDKIRKDTGHSISRQMIGRWIIEHGNAPPRNYRLETDKQESIRFITTISKHMCPKCRKWIAIACMSDMDIDEFIDEVRLAKKQHCYNSILKNKVELIKTFHKIDI